MIKYDGYHDDRRLSTTVLCIFDKNHRFVRGFKRGDTNVGCWAMDALFTRWTRNWCSNARTLSLKRLFDHSRSPPPSSTVDEPSDNDQPTNQPTTAAKPNDLRTPNPRDAVDCVASALLRHRRRRRRCCWWWLWRCGGLAACTGLLPHQKVRLSPRVHASGGGARAQSACRLLVLVLGVHIRTGTCACACACAVLALVCTHGIGVIGVWEDLAVRCELMRALGNETTTTTSSPAAHLVSVLLSLENMTNCCCCCFTTHTTYSTR